MEKVQVKPMEKVLKCL